MRFAGCIGEAALDWIAIALAASVPIALVGVILNRCLVTHESDNGNVLRGKGIGWQVIRLCLLVTAIPIVGLLALQGIVAGDAAIGVIGAGLGYAFGKVD